MRQLRGPRGLAALTAVLALASAALVACGGGDEEADVSGSVVVDGRIDPALTGAWRVLGEGTLVDISRQGIAEYQQTASLCYADPQGSTDDPSAFDGYSFSRHTEGSQARAELFELPGTAAASMLERIDRIPDNCRTPVPADPIRTAKALCELMQQDYPFFAERGIDWSARCTALAARAAAAADDDALQAALIEALTGFNDAHVKLYRGQGEERQQVFSAGNLPTQRLLKQAFESQTAVSDLRAFQLAWRDDLIAQVGERVVGEAHEALNGTFLWGRMGDNIGYLLFLRMQGFSEDASLGSDVQAVRAAMDEALAGLGDTRALIVDVSLNGGGYDAVSAEIAGSFADRRRLAFTKRSQRPQGRPDREVNIEPVGTHPYRKPVYVLTSDLTGSAAETFTLMMRTLPNALQVGQTTTGSLSDILDKSLPGPFSVTFSNEIDIDPAGVSYEVKGIPPQRPLTLFDAAVPDSLFTGHAAALDALLELAAR